MEEMFQLVSVSDLYVMEHVAFLVAPMFFVFIIKTAPNTWIKLLFVWMFTLKNPI